MQNMGKEVFFLKPVAKEAEAMIAQDAPLIHPDDYKKMDENS